MSIPGFEFLNVHPILSVGCRKAGKELHLFLFSVKASSTSTRGSFESR